MKGFNEAWWFLDSWEKDIVRSQEFENHATACQCYQELYQNYVVRFDSFKSQSPHTSAFWNEGETVWCASCQDYLQTYYGLLLIDERQNVR